MDGISQSQAMVLVWSANASESSDVTREVHHAFRKGVAVVPFRIEDVAFRKELEFYLETVHWLDALTPPLEAHLEHLAQVIQRLLSKDGTQTREEGTSLPFIGKVNVEVEAGERSLSAHESKVANPHRPSSAWAFSRGRQLMIAGLISVVPLSVVAVVYSGLRGADGISPLVFSSSLKPIPPPPFDSMSAKPKSWAHTEETSPINKIYAGAANGSQNDQNSYFVILTPPQTNEESWHCCYHNFEIHHVTWSPDSTRLISMDENTLIVWDPNTPDNKRSWPVHYDEVTNFKFRDRQNLLLTYSSGAVERFNLMTGENKGVATGMAPRQGLVEILVK
jgi:hypothetical protein